MKNILDLDSITTWHQELSAFVYAIDVWSQVEAIRKNNGEDAFLAALKRDDGPLVENCFAVARVHVLRAAFHRFQRL